MTTIEFCVKYLKQQGYSSSPYDLGLLGNFSEILGKNPFYWLLPVATNAGDGLSFVNENTRLTVDLDVGANLRKKGPRRGRAVPGKTRSLGGASDDENTSELGGTVGVL